MSQLRLFGMHGTLSRNLSRSSQHLRRFCTQKQATENEAEKKWELTYESKMYPFIYRLKRFSLISACGSLVFAPCCVWNPYNAEFFTMAPAAAYAVGGLALFVGLGSTAGVHSFTKNWGINGWISSDQKELKVQFLTVLIRKKYKIFTIDNLEPNTGGIVKNTQDKTTKEGFFLERKGAIHPRIRNKIHGGLTAEEIKVLKEQGKI